jgi:hypothetical protein
MSDNVLEVPLKNLSLFAILVSIAASLAFPAYCLPAGAQSIEPRVSVTPILVRDENTANASRTTENSASLVNGFSSSNAGSLLDGADPEASLPAAPEPGGLAGNPQREGVPYAAEWHAVPFSRIGIGADVSLLGIGIKSAVLLDEYFDARLDLNFFSYTSSRIEVDGVNATGNLHMASGAAKVDLYPKNSIWRISAGLMLFDGNRATANLAVVPGTSFTLDNQTFYSANANPMTATGLVQLDTIKPAPLVSFGFGRFIPRSNRHWSFPTEFGVIYEGGPSLNVNTAGSVCTDQAQTQCSSINDTSTPVGQAFNAALQEQLTKWRADFDKVKLYPIFSYSVVYSFNIR